MLVQQVLPTQCKWKSGEAVFLGSWNRQDLPSQEMKFVEAENLASSRQREVEPRALEGISSIFHPRGTPRKLSKTHDTRKMHQFDLF